MTLDLLLIQWIWFDAPLRELLLAVDAGLFAFWNEMARVPGWAWWAMGNLAIGCWISLAHITELQHERRGVELSVRGMIVFAFSVVGVFVLLCLAFVAWLERVAFEARRAADGSNDRDQGATP
jgi:hypothetical protein